MNLIGTFNVIRLAAAQMAKNDAERGGRARRRSSTRRRWRRSTARSARRPTRRRRAGVVGMTLPIARDLAVARHPRPARSRPGTFDTPMLAMAPEPLRQALAAQIPFPSRLGRPERVRGAGAAHRRERHAERRDHPARRRDPHGAEVTDGARHAMSSGSASASSAAATSAAPSPPTWCRTATASRVHDSRPERLRPLVGLGARAADSPAEGGRAQRDHLHLAADARGRRRGGAPVARGRGAGIDPGRPQHQRAGQRARAGRAARGARAATCSRRRSPAARPGAQARMLVFMVGGDDRGVRRACGRSSRSSGAPPSTSGRSGSATRRSW